MWEIRSVKMDKTNLFEWLLDSDPSIRWQVMSEIVGMDGEIAAQERQKTETQGWGAKLLSYQDDYGLWGGQLYNHKWLSTTYTLLLLRQIGLEPNNQQAQLGCKVLLEGGFRENGSLSYAKAKDLTDNGVVAMILSLLAYFRYPDGRVHRISDFLLDQQLENGRWEPYPGNLQTKYTFDTTLLCLEAMWECQKQVPERSKQAAAAQLRGREFLLCHKLYQQELKEEIIDKKMALFSFPPRWHYDILTALDYFQACKAERDLRLKDAIDLLKAKQNRDGTWNLQNRHAGKTFFEMEEVGRPSRWNTMRALRILKWWEGS
jgi:hypothetical protein